MFNPLNFISKFIKSSNQKELDRLQKIVDKINAFEEQISKLQICQGRKNLQLHKVKLHQLRQIIFFLKFSCTT